MVMFHWYGLILGLGLMVAIALVEKKARQLGWPLKELEALLIWIVLGGVIGARLWHLATDWEFYRNQSLWLSVISVWQGGLSILGAITGGVVAASIAIRWQHASLSLKQVLDLAVFGLPLAQVIGRFGNFVNQELYGLPSRLPWAIQIDEAHRLSAYQHFATYHPLFAYESLLVGLCGLFIWWSARSPRRHQWLGPVGTGRWFVCYLVYYAGVRFGLDFIRLDKAVVPSIGLGINQLIMLGVIVGGLLFLLTTSATNKHKKESHA